MNKAVIGWDVGGAHLKASLLDVEGKLQQVMQVSCALWRGLAELERAIDIVLNAFTNASVLHTITMTGELVDLFQSRKDGVQSICRLMNEKLQGRKLFYAGALNADSAAFVTLPDVGQHWQYIASANWLASAGFIGQRLQKSDKNLIPAQVQHGLLIDIGSTTSDFVLFENGVPNCIAYTDAMRMQSEELVYTGVVRTPLMAVTQKIQFNHKVTYVAAEYFATTADVYRLTGDLLATDDMADTADGKEKTQLASARRIARMIGYDADDASMAEWIALAQAFKSQQIKLLKNAALHHISRLKSVSTIGVNDDLLNTICIVGAGAGSFLAKEIAQALHTQYIDVAQLITIESDAKDVLLDISETRRLAQVCLPAYAVAYLAYHQF